MRHGERAGRPESGRIARTLSIPTSNHLWNRINAALFLRTDQGRKRPRCGRDSTCCCGRTPPLLPTGPSHQRALTLLDEFLSTHAENQVTDPVKRAWFQRNLWAVFDWSAPILDDSYAAGRQELQVRLAEVLRRVALTPAQIKALPDTYAQAVASGEFGKEYDPAHPDRRRVSPARPAAAALARGSCRIQGDNAPVAEIALDLRLRALELSCLSAFAPGPRRNPRVHPQSLER